MTSNTSYPGTELPPTLPGLPTEQSGAIIEPRQQSIVKVPSPDRRALSLRVTWTARTLLLSTAIGIPKVTITH